MSEIRLSNEEDVIYAVSCIPMVIIFVAIVVYYSFFRLSEIYPPGSDFGVVLWDILPYVIAPGLILAPLSFLATFELVYCWKTHSKWQLQIRRFLGRLIIQLVAVLIFILIYVFFLIFLLPSTSASITLVVISLTWSFSIYTIMRGLRKTVARLEKGEW